MSRDESNPSSIVQFASADQALEAIRAFRENQWLPFVLAGSPKAKMPSFPWGAAAAAIKTESGLATLPLDLELFKTIETMIGDIPQEHRAIFEKVVADWGQSHWEDVVDWLRGNALRALGEYLGAFAKHTSAWPRLREDGALLRHSMERLRSSSSQLSIPYIVRDLAQIRGTVELATEVLNQLVRNQIMPREVAPHFANLALQWAGTSAWGRIQYLLWRNSTNQLPAEEFSKPVHDAFSLLKAIRLTTGTYSTEFHLCEVSAEARATWRRMLRDATALEPDLKLAVIGVLLWFGSKSDDREVLFAVIELCRDDAKTVMAVFQEHQSRIVQMRIRAVQDLIGGEPDAASLLAQSRKKAEKNGQYVPTQSRTWIDDVDLERMIENSFDSAARSAAQDFATVYKAGEEPLLAVLFERLRAACERATEQLEQVALERGDGKRVVLSRSHRHIERHEEGGPGIVEDSRFSTDVCLLFRARDEKGTTFAERVCFLQAKRIADSPRAPGVSYYQIKMDQLEDLRKQTESSFVLLLGPPVESISIPIMPASLLHDLVRAEIIPRNISPRKAAQLSKSLSAWMLEDVIGLWTGDSNPQLMMKAQGEVGRRPYIWAELLVEIRPTRE